MRTCFIVILALVGFSHVMAAGEQTQQVVPNDESTSKDNNLTPLERRVAIEMGTRFHPFVLSPHKPNYILPYTYSETPNQAPFDPTVDGPLQKEEIKFQFSLKFPIADELFGESGSLYFAYTNLSFWQAYNSSHSSPFRETNHEPELFITIPNDWEIWGFKNRLNSIGVVHQSNGRGASHSRSWDRIYAEFIFERENVYLSFRPWIRVPTTGEEDNPDIEHFMGHGELRIAYATGRHTAAVLLRNNFRSDNRGAIELDFSTPMSRRAKWFVQFFDGYGESLIDYNARIRRFGVGVALTDWL